MVECSARTNTNIKEVFKTFLFLSKIASNVSVDSRISSRRTSDEETKDNGNNINEKNIFPRSDEIILTSANISIPSQQLRSRWGSLKHRPSPPQLDASLKGSPLRRNVSAYGRTGRFNGRKVEFEDQQNDDKLNGRRRVKSSQSVNKGNVKIDPLQIHLEQVMI